MKIEITHEKLHSFSTRNASLGHGTLPCLFESKTVLYTDNKPFIKLGTVHTKALNLIQEAMLEYYLFQNCLLKG